jgi:hypothetical protein
MAIDPKFADAVKLRFSKGKTPEASKPDDTDDESGNYSDAEDFRMLKAAWNAGNGPDFCEYLRRITSK